MTGGLHAGTTNVPGAAWRPPDGCGAITDGQSPRDFRARQQGRCLLPASTM